MFVLRALPRNGSALLVAYLLRASLSSSSAAIGLHVTILMNIRKLQCYGMDCIHQTKSLMACSCQQGIEPFFSSKLPEIT
jgi:hypothetical protein